MHGSSPRDALLRLVENPDLVPTLSPHEALALVMQLSALQTRLAVIAAGAVGTNGVDAGPTCYDMRDVAARLKMDLSHVYKLAKRGELVSFRHGRAVRVRREDLEHFMHQRRIT